MTDRVVLHKAAVALVTVRARRAGLDVRTDVPLHNTHDLVVNGQRVAVRAARVAVRTHAVMMRGQRYVYQYPKLLWNTHGNDGKPAGDRVDTWVFAWQHRDRWRCYIVPSRILHGPTLSMHPRRLTAAQRRHWLVGHEEQWQSLKLREAAWKSQ